MATRVANANTNPQDLELSTDEEDKLPKVKSRKRKGKKTDAEKAAEKAAAALKREQGLAAVSIVEEDMARQASIQGSTPHASSVLRQLSYVVPDLPAARSILEEVAADTLTSTADDTEEDLRPAKKYRPLREDVKAFKAAKGKAKALDFSEAMVSITQLKHTHILTYSNRKLIQTRKRSPMTAARW